MSEKTVCEKNKCTGCMTCVEICPKNAIKIDDTIQSYNAYIDPLKCINCGLCYGICQNNQNINLTRPIKCQQGWIGNEKIRANSSSGGLAFALSQTIISWGGVVCSCCFRNGQFNFDFVDNVEQLYRFSGSKYVKSNPLGVYKEIRKRLSNGQKVLFIGLPCQVAAVKLFMGGKFEELLYTVDLICHGTPSPHLLEDFLKENNIEITDIENINFRYIKGFGDKNIKNITLPGILDEYLLAFLCNIDYTDNCYECRYAGMSRVSDITIGDSWDSDQPLEEQEKGISLILSQSVKGLELINKSNLKVFNVNIDRAINANAQLRRASAKTKNHDKFFKHYNGENFKMAVWFALPQKCLKQKIKALLIRLKILPEGHKSYMLSIVEKSDIN